MEHEVWVKVTPEGLLPLQTRLNEMQETLGDCMAEMVREAWATDQDVFLNENDVKICFASKDEWEQYKVASAVEPPQNIDVRVSFWSPRKMVAWFFS